MARFMEKFAVCNVLDPAARRRCRPTVYAKLPRHNFIDGHVWDEAAAARHHAVRAGRATRTFLRRAYLDVIGRLPTPDETRAFLADTDPTKRAKLIDALLERPEYADFWANKWADLLRPNPYRVGIKAVVQPRRLAPRRASARTSPTTSSSASCSTAQGSTFTQRRGGRSSATAASRTRSRRWSASSSSASGSTARSATTTRSRSGARTTSTASPPSSPASAARAPASRRRSPAARRSIFTGAERAR